MPPIINKDKCIGCMNCVTICPMDVYGKQEKDAKTPVIHYPDECWHCNACVVECPAKALSIRVPLPAMMVFVDAPKKKDAQQ